MHAWVWPSGWKAKKAPVLVNLIRGAPTHRTLQQCSAVQCTLSLSSLTPGWPASTVVRERGLSLHVLCVLPGVRARGSLHLQRCWRALVHSTSKQLCPPHIYCSAMNFPLSPTAEYPDPSGPALRPQLCLVYLYLYIHAPAGPFPPIAPPCSQRRAAGPAFFSLPLHYRPSARLGRACPNFSLRPCPPPRRTLPL
jgi:hypothetical protein